MVTDCYAMVRGSAIRVTGLDKRGSVADPATFAVSKSIAKVTINEVVEQGSNEIIKTAEEERRLRFVRSAQTIRYKVDIDFLCVDPAVFGLVAGVQLVRKGLAGFDTVGFDLDGFGGWPDGSEAFGTGAWGVIPFGGSLDEVAEEEVIGFDATTRLPITAFALEVWSKLDQDSSRPKPPGFGDTAYGDGPFGEAGTAWPRPARPGFGDGPYGDGPFGELGYAPSTCRDGRRYGYTLFPHLRGGHLSGFQFTNGAMSFKLIGAQTRRASRWGVGPYDLEGPYERLIEPVSRNTAFRTFITTAAPPVAVAGVQRAAPDVLDNGTAANPMPDADALFSVDGGGADTGPFIIYGGRA